MDTKDAFTFIEDTSSPQKRSSSLAESLISKGQLAMIKGDFEAGSTYFDEALKIDPDNDALYYAQGLSLFEYGEKQQILKILWQASKKFKRATELNPSPYSYWQIWATVLCKLGIGYKIPHYFQDALEKIKCAIENDKEASQHADLFWEMGLIYMHIAAHSKEAVDLHGAIHAFHTAHSLHPQMPADFWKEYGIACHKLALLINDQGFWLKAISCLKNALALSPTSSENWHLLAQIFQALYFHSHEEEHFSGANAAYDTATRLQPTNGSFWLHWAQFLCKSSREGISDINVLRACIEKCQEGISCDPENPHIHIVWAEALARLGSQTEKLNDIYSAQNKISAYIQTLDYLPEVWYVYAITLKALGHYFTDIDYYYQAIEALQEGLSLDRTCHMHWHAIGYLFTLLGELEHDTEMLKRSLKFYQKALENTFSPTYSIGYAIALYKLASATQEQSLLEQAAWHFEHAMPACRNNILGMFYYACTLDALGDFYEEEKYYLHAIEIFSQILMIQSDFHSAHHQLALTLAHLGELTAHIDYFYRALHHFRQVAKQGEENDVFLIDWAVALINMAYHVSESSESDLLYLEAEQKLWSAVQLGNPHAYYHLACLYSLSYQYEKAMQCLYKGAHFDILPSLEEMLDDEWLDHLRTTGEFSAFLFQLKKRL